MFIFLITITSTLINNISGILNNLMVYSLIGLTGIWARFNYKLAYGLSDEAVVSQSLENQIIACIVFCSEHGS